jgi:hypothetical protein
VGIGAQPDANTTVVGDSLRDDYVPVAYVLATPKPNGCRSPGKDFLCARNNSDYKLWTFAEFL